MQTAISTPFAVLDELFDSRVRDFRRFTSAASAHFRSLLSSSGADYVGSVPLLTAESLKNGTVRPNSLVRFVGYVQDVFEPELYAPAVDCSGGPGVRLRKSCAFRDTMPGDPDCQFVEALEQR
jgi:Mini-chromosome maintenance replisome factor